MIEDAYESCRNCIHNSPLFEGLSDDELNYLASFASNQSFKKGEVIISQGEEIQFISFLKKGLLKVYNHGEDKKDQIISIARPNDCVGLLSIFSNRNYQYSIGAIEDSVLYFVELTRVKYIIRNNGSFGLKLLGRISMAADQIINTAINISKKNLRGRIAYILLEFSEHIYKNSRFDLPVSRKEMAELIGMTTENVIRILSEFRRDGIITIQGKTITILRQDTLKMVDRNG